MPHKCQWRCGLANCSAACDASIAVQTLDVSWKRSGQTLSFDYQLLLVASEPPSLTAGSPLFACSPKN